MPVVVVLWWGAGLCLALLGIVTVLAGWDRYRPGRSRPPAESALAPTAEVFVDPVSGRRQRVWSDPVTGARDYRDE